MRKQAPALRKSDEDQIHFNDYEDPLHLSFTIYGEPAGDPYDYFVVLNGNNESGTGGDLPEGKWQLIVNEKKAGFESLSETSGNYELEPSSGKVFRRKNSLD